MKRIYRVAYQLGGEGRTNHRTIKTAADAVRRARRRAAIDGDRQGIGITAYDYDPCRHYYVVADLTDAERDEIQYSLLGDR